MIRSILLPALMLGLATPVLIGCTNAGDNGKPCQLVKRDPEDTDPSDGIRRVRIREEEIEAGTDFISFAAVDCEDLVCVRESTAPLTGNPLAEVQGKCSRPCVEGTECPSAQDGVTLSCKALLLDEQTLADIEKADKVRFENAFGSTKSPFFCVADPAPASN
ncbi:MAG TPA: adventurous gliding motility lipoprotein CglC [Myxococcaceae bacterium]|nr:adventurous gliding motility lipoprotein CglC [Myxococcaceae bacterium]